MDFSCLMVISLMERDARTMMKRFVIHFNTGGIFMENNHINNSKIIAIQWSFLVSMCLDIIASQEYKNDRSNPVRIS